MKLDFASGGLCLKIGKHVSEQQTRHIQCGCRSSAAAAGLVSAVDKEEAETSVICKNTAAAYLFLCSTETQHVLLNVDLIEVFAHFINGEDDLAT